jgi:hypothetical protein
LQAGDDLVAVSEIELGHRKMAPREVVFNRRDFSEAIGGHCRERADAHGR